MAKVKEEKFVPKPDEVNAMSLCWKNDNKINFQNEKYI